ncbi:MAG: sigma-54-dependent transcriptional regulator [Candidatus Binatia bacterium]
MPNQAANVLVLDDSQSVLQAIRMTLDDPGFRVILCERAEEALSVMEEEEIDLAISDIRMPGLDGHGFLDRALEIDPNVDVMFITGFSTVEEAVSSLHQGAVHYLPKPFSPTELLETVKEVIAARRQTERCPTEKFRNAVAPIIGRSSHLLEVLPLIEQFAQHSTTVLVHGETGSGKELIARAIHAAGPRSEGPYVVCNCSAFSDTLMESEFFGHSKGAFTDADDCHAGLYEMAHGGVLFLDEIGDLPLVSQAKLLRALESGEIHRVGEVESRRFDVQVVAATNKDLAEEVRQGRFRKDLYFRLNVAQIRLPPLRDRRDDVPALSEKFLTDAAAEYGVTKPAIDPAAMDALKRYAWPGNIRELRNVLYRAMLFHSRGDLAVSELPPEIAEAAADAPPADTSIDAVRREYIRTVLERVNGNKSDAAKVLGVSRVTLYREIQRYRLHA